MTTTLQKIWKELYFDTDVSTIYKFYDRSGYYIFRRKMHDRNKYREYLKENKNNASKKTLTYPAYLLSPRCYYRRIRKISKIDIKRRF